MTVYWHGGGRIDGDEVLPPEESGISRSGDEGVHITTDRTLAETYASTVEGPAWVYEVEPVGEVTPVPSLLFPDKPPISFVCERARIVRRFTIPSDRREHMRAVVERSQILLPDDLQ